MLFLNGCFSTAELIFWEETLILEFFDVSEILA